MLKMQRSINKALSIIDILATVISIAIIMLYAKQSMGIISYIFCYVIYPVGSFKGDYYLFCFLIQIILHFEMYKALKEYGLYKYRGLCFLLSFFLLLVLVGIYQINSY